MTRDEIIEDIMSRASLLATKKVRRYLCQRPGFSGPETEAFMSIQVKKYTEELRAAVEAAVPLKE